MPNALTFPTPRDLGQPSHFDHFQSKAQPTKWGQVVTTLRDPQYSQGQTILARAALEMGNEEAYAAHKALLHAFTPAASFAGTRNSAHVVRLTGVSMCDFDNIDDPQRLKECADLAKHDPHTFLMYVTPSGRGLRVLFRYATQASQVAYIDAWTVGQQHYAQLLGLASDPACKDVTRLSFYSYDPDAYYHPESEPFFLPLDDERRFSPCGLEEHLAAARADRGEKPDVARQQLSLFDRAEAVLARQRQGLTYTAADKAPEYAKGSRHAYLIQLAQLACKFGAAEGDVRAYIAPRCPRGEKEAEGIVGWVFAHLASQAGCWADGGSRVPKAPARRTRAASVAEPLPDPARTARLRRSLRVALVTEWLNANYALRYNVVSDNIEIASKVGDAARQQRNAAGKEANRLEWKILNDRAQNDIWAQCCRALEADIPAQVVNDLLHSNAIATFNPLTEYLEALPAFEETARDRSQCDASAADPIGAFARRVHTPCPELFERCFRKWFVAMIASWCDPAVLNENILTLIGPQGIFKSTFFRLLLPPELRPYFLVKGNSSRLNKDDLIAVSNFALIDLEEIDTIRDCEQNSLKALVTTEVVSERAAYARNRDARPHIASFCATGNNRHFLTDPTGNRRWLPFEVISIDNPYLYPVDYPLLYAQAYWLYRNRYQHYFTQDEDLQLEGYKSDFAQANLEEEFLRHSFRQPMQHECGQFFSTAEIIRTIALDSRVTLTVRAVSRAIVKIGWSQVRHNNLRGYVLVARQAADISAEQTAAAVNLQPNVGRGSGADCEPNVGFGNSADGGSKSSVDCENNGSMPGSPTDGSGQNSKF